MKIHVSKEDIAEGIATIQPAMAARATIPALNNFLVETYEGGLRLASTDLNVGVKHLITAKIDTAGGITIPARKFAEIVGSMGDAGIDLTVSEDGKISVSSGKSRFRMVGIPIQEYPVVPDFKDEGSFAIAADVLEDMISKTVFAASKDTTRHTLMGLEFKAEGGTLTVAGTDGRRLACVSRKCLPEDLTFKATIPATVLLDVAKMLKKIEGDARVCITDNTAAFKVGKTTVVTRLVAGLFPEYKNVIPTEFASKLTVAASALIEITKRASLCTDNLRKVTFTVENGILKVASKAATMDFEDEIQVTGGVEKVEVSFNPDFVLDSLKALAGSIIEVNFGGAFKPALLRPQNDQEYASVVMPMR